MMSFPTIRPFTLTYSVPQPWPPQTLLTQSGLGPLNLLLLMPGVFFPGLSTWLALSQPHIFAPNSPQ